MSDINRITICRDNHESQEEFENAIRDAIMLLMNEGYVMVVRYDEPGLGIVCIDFDYDDIMLSGRYPCWITPDEWESIDAERLWQMTDKQKHVDEMARTMCFQSKSCPVKSCVEVNCETTWFAEKLYNAGYRKQIEGEWEWFEEWNPSTPEHPRECDDCGWMCGKCKVALEDMVGGYWDNAFEKPKLNFCPNCGVRMKGGESDA